MEKQWCCCTTIKLSKVLLQSHLVHTHLESWPHLRGLITDFCFCFCLWLAFLWKFVLESQTHWVSQTLISVSSTWKSFIFYLWSLAHQCLGNTVRKKKSGNGIYLVGLFPFNNKSSPVWVGWSPMPSNNYLIYVAQRL